MSSSRPESLSSQTDTPSAGLSSQDRARAIQTMKLMYQTAQQAEYLHLQAETELLLQQLQALQQRRLAVSSVGSQSS